jgi:hypothetical protein
MSVDSLIEWFCSGPISLEFIVRHVSELIELHGVGRLGAIGNLDPQDFLLGGLKNGFSVAVLGN